MRKITIPLSRLPKRWLLTKLLCKQQPDGGEVTFVEIGGRALYVSFAGNSDLDFAMAVDLTPHQLNYIFERIKP